MGGDRDELVARADGGAQFRNVPLEIRGRDLVVV
jgi:hypothetical protein